MRLCMYIDVPIRRCCCSTAAAGRLQKVGHARVARPGLPARPGQPGRIPTYSQGIIKGVCIKGYGVILKYLYIYIYTYICINYPVIFIKMLDVSLGVACGAKRCCIVRKTFFVHFLCCFCDVRRGNKLEHFGSKTMKVVKDDK